LVSFQQNLSGFFGFPFLFRDAISSRASDGNRLKANSFNFIVKEEGFVL